MNPGSGAPPARAFALLEEIRELGERAGRALGRGDLEVAVRCIGERDLPLRGLVLLQRKGEIPAGPEWKNSLAQVMDLDQQVERDFAAATQRMEDTRGEISRWKSALGAYGPNRSGGAVLEDVS